MKKRLLSLTLIAALCLSLFPVGTAPALAADDTVYVGGVELTGSTDSPAYATTDDSGTVTTVDASADNYNIKWDGSTLTLNSATITGAYIESEYLTFGIYASSSGDVSLEIALQGKNTITSGGYGILVQSSGGDATLTIKSESDGSLTASGSYNPGIQVLSSSGDAALTIQDTDVTAEGGDYANGVTVQAGSAYNQGHNATLTVNGGKLTASGDAGIEFNAGNPSYNITTELTVSGNALVDTRDSSIVVSGNNTGTGSLTPTGDGIVFNGDEGTVYGEVTLQEDLTIGEGESLTLDDGASLNAGGHNVIVDGGTLDEGFNLGDSVKYTPTITTESLAGGAVGTSYSQTLTATGTTPITWSGDLPAGLTLNKNGTITGIPTAQGESKFTVTATNAYGSDSQELTLTINAQTNVPVTSVTLNKSSLSLEVGNTETLTATITPSNATNKTVTWESSDTSIATVDQNGKVTAIAPGTATITVTTEDGSKTDTCAVTVTAQPSYSISATPAALNFGSIDDGQAAPAAQTVTITNTSNQTVTLNQPTAANYVIGTLSATELTPGATTTFTVQPKTGLSAGTYNETLTISGSDSASAEIALTFTVNKRPYTGKYSYEIVSAVGENGTIDVDRYATEGDQVTITVSPDEAYLLDELTVTSGGKDVALTDNGDGTYTFTMPSGDVAITATFAEDPNWEEPATDVSEIFTDVPANHWAQAAIQYVYDNGLMTGVSDTAFAPEATTTRAMIVSMLARMENVTSAADAGFTDVNASDWYATAVNWAAANGIVSGISDDTFAPNDPITREQLAAMLMKYAQYKGFDTTARADLSHYSDAENISSWANDVLSWAVAEGLLAGVTDDQLQPQAATTRAQTAAVIQRFLTAESLENK